MLKPLSLLALVGAALMFPADPVFAAPVNFFGADDTMGTVSYGQHGIIDNLITTTTGKTKEYLEGAGMGFLPPDSEITFTYTFLNDFGNNGKLEAHATYKQTIGNYNYFAFSSTNDGDYSYKERVGGGKKINVPPPIFATADMNHNDTKGIVTIVNDTNTEVSFSSYFVSIFQSICGREWDKDDVIVHYKVSGDPAPLPDALPMFVAALAALAGFSLFRRIHANGRSAR